MKTSFLLLTLVGLLVAGCGGKPEESGAQPSSPNTNQTQAQSGNPISAPVDYLGAVGQAGQHAAKVVDLVQVQTAIRQFHAVEDRYPKNLQELVSSGYLTRLPQLSAGMQLLYDPRTGQVRAVRRPGGR